MRPRASVPACAAAKSNAVLSTLGPLSTGKAVDLAARAGCGADVGRWAARECVAKITAGMAPDLVSARTRAAVRT